MGKTERVHVRTRPGPVPLVRGIVDHTGPQVSGVSTLASEELRTGNRRRPVREDVLSGHVGVGERKVGRVSSTRGEEFEPGPRRGGCRFCSSEGTEWRLRVRGRGSGPPRRRQSRRGPGRVGTSRPDEYPTSPSTPESCDNGDLWTREASWEREGPEDVPGLHIPSIEDHLPGVRHP